MGDKKTDGSGESMDATALVALCCGRESGEAPGRFYFAPPDSKASGITTSGSGAEPRNMRAP